MTIRLVRLFTGSDDESHFEISDLPLTPEGPRQVSEWGDVSRMRFEVSDTGADLGWHVAPRRQFVITMTGTIEFEMRDGTTFVLAPGDVLLAEDTTGGGHRWRAIGHEPWRRAYVALPDPSG